ncbi:MAG: hypothetical protein D6800_13040, partial [Candidatus Zixiibacteriota bacterium]
LLDNDCSGGDTLPGDSDGIFVSTSNGNNSNPGTITQPLQTIQAAINLVNNGQADRIYVATGIYTESQLQPQRGALYGGFTTDFSSQDTMATPTTFDSTSNDAIFVNVGASFEIGGVWVDVPDGGTRRIIQTWGNVNAHHLFVPGVGACGNKQLFHVERTGVLRLSNVTVTEVTDTCGSTLYGVYSSGRVVIRNTQINFSDGAFGNVFGIAQFDSRELLDLDGLTVRVGTRTADHATYGVYAEGPAVIRNFVLTTVSRGEHNGIYHHIDSVPGFGDLTVENATFTFGAPACSGCTHTGIYAQNGGAISVRGVDIDSGGGNVSHRFIYINNVDQVDLSDVDATGGDNRYGIRAVEILSVMGGVAVDGVRVTQGATLNDNSNNYGLYIFSAENVSIRDSFFYAEKSPNRVGGAGLYLADVNDVNLANVHVTATVPTISGWQTQIYGAYIRPYGNLSIDGGSFVAPGESAVNFYPRMYGLYVQSYNGDVGGLSVNNAVIRAGNGLNSTGFYLDWNNNTSLADGVIRNNTIEQGAAYYYMYGLRLQNHAGYLLIADNTIRPTASKTSGACGYSHYGIRDDNAREVDFVGNTIRAPFGYYCDNTYGLYMPTSGTFSIVNNQIHGGHGRYTRGLYLDCDSAVVAGNTIFGGYAGVHSSYYGYGRGVEERDSTCYADYINNTVYGPTVTYANSTNYAMYVRPRFVSGGVPNHIVNNIIYPVTTGGSDRGLYLSGCYGNGAVSLQHNIFYGGDSSYRMYDSCGGYYDTEAELNETCKASGSCDAASGGNQIIDPELVDPPDDLHLDSDSPAIGAGASILTTYRGIDIPDITEDIDGDARNLSTPDVGADER